MRGKLCLLNWEIPSHLGGSQSILCARARVRVRVRIRILICIHHHVQVTPLGRRRKAIVYCRLGGGGCGLDCPSGDACRSLGDDLGSDILVFDFPNVNELIKFRVGRTRSTRNLLAVNSADVRQVAGDFKEYCQNGERHYRCRVCLKAETPLSPPPAPSSICGH